MAARLWFLVHADTGPLLVGLWYRPPNSELAHIESLRLELQKLQSRATNTLLFGDINVHHQKRLRHSNSNTAEGELFEAICSEHCLVQTMKEPTRGRYLLDLALSTMPNDTKSVVLPKLA